MSNVLWDIVEKVGVIVGLVTSIAAIINWFRPPSNAGTHHHNSPVSNTGTGHNRPQRTSLNTYEEYPRDRMNNWTYLEGQNENTPNIITSIFNIISRLFSLLFTIMVFTILGALVGLTIGFFLITSIMLAILGDDMGGIHPHNIYTMWITCTTIGAIFGAVVAIKDGDE